MYFWCLPCILGFWKRNKRIWPPTYCIFKISLCGKSVFSICLISLYFSTPPPAPNPVGRSPHKWSLEFHFLHLYHQFIVSRPFHCSSRLLCVRIEYEYKYLSLSTSRLLEKYNQNLAFSYSSHSFSLSLSLSLHLPLMLRHRMHIILRLLTLFFCCCMVDSGVSLSLKIGDQDPKQKQNPNNNSFRIIVLRCRFCVRNVYDNLMLKIKESHMDGMNWWIKWKWNGYGYGVVLKRFLVHIDIRYNIMRFENAQEGVWDLIRPTLSSNMASYSILGNLICVNLVL